MRWVVQYKDLAVHDDIAIRFMTKFSLLCPFKVPLTGNILRISAQLHKAFTFVCQFTIVSKINAALGVLCCD